MVVENAADCIEHVYNRIKGIEPEKARLIFNHLLLRLSIPGMIRLSSSTDMNFQQKITQAKLDTTLDSPFELFDFEPSPFSLFHDWTEDYNYGQLDSVHYVPGDFFNDNYSHPRAKNSPILPEIPFKVCSFYRKGICKYGKNCKNIHVTHMDKDKGSVMFRSNPDDQEHMFYSSRSLQKLEMELIQLLRRLKGNPISIAALPMFYLEMYGRSLQAEGYRTESQRNGKAGFSLSRLLERLPSILVLGRPHGQHYVMLAEDGPKHKYKEFIREKRQQRLSSLSVPEETNNSRQIYLTFPADSTFSELDVFNYFNTIGPVIDVRLPNQFKRMYGFVAFKNADTVRRILAKGKPHLICGARVLAKPYMDKNQLIQKKLMMEKFLSCPVSQYVDQYQMFQSSNKNSTTNYPLNYEDKDNCDFDLKLLLPDNPFAFYLPDFE